MKKLLVCSLLVMLNSTVIAKSHRTTLVKSTHLANEESFTLLYGILPYPLSFSFEIQKMGSNETQRKISVQRFYPLSEACTCAVCKKNIFALLWGSSITPPKVVHRLQRY